MVTLGDRSGSPPLSRPKVILKDGLSKALRERLEAEQPDSVARLNETIMEVWNANTSIFEPRRNGRIQRSTYWWNDSIAGMWRECNRVRWRLNRLRARKPPTCPGALELHHARIEAALNGYRESRSVLRKEIKRSKREHWNLLIAEVEESPWGKPYQLVRGKL
jgi:hypothetical protein